MASLANGLRGLLCAPYHASGLHTALTATVALQVTLQGDRCAAAAAAAAACLVPLLLPTQLVLDNIRESGNLPVVRQAAAAIPAHQKQIKHHADDQQVLSVYGSATCHGKLE
jgi:hypothetical protein